MLRYLYLTCFLFFSLSFAMAGSAVKQSKVKQVLHYDTEKVAVRTFDKVALKNYSAQNEFQYSDTYVGESLWTRFWRWFWSLFDPQDTRTAAGIFGVILKYLFIGLGVAAIVFLILRLIGIDASSIIRRKPQSSLTYSESLENIYAVDFDAEIEKAISKQNYRLAVRLLYLRLLKQLSDVGLINWDITKTNSIYIDELSNAEQRLTFKLLTRQFEYIWYGERLIDADVFKKVNSLFSDFKILPK